MVCRKKWESTVINEAFQNLLSFIPADFPDFFSAYWKYGEVNQYMHVISHYSAEGFIVSASFEVP